MPDQAHQSDSTWELEALARQSGLRVEVLEKLQGVFRAHPAITRVVLYGSRAKGNWRPNSDIDLAPEGQQLDWPEFLRIQNELDDLLLPWKIDLSLFEHIDNEALVSHIRRVGIPLYP